MTVLAALQKAAIRLAGRKPVSFFGVTDKLEIELASLAETVAEDIAQYHEWQALTNIHTVVSDGIAGDYPMPDDFDRFPLTGTIMDGNTLFWGYSQYHNLDGFLLDEARDFNAAPGGWVIYGDRIRFAPVPELNARARFAYISENYALSPNTTPQKGFTSDMDEFRLPERLLTLGVIWRWREDKGLFSAGDETAFIKAMDEAAAKDSGPSVIRRNSGSSILRTHLAYPWTLGQGANYWPNV